jgi:hypothetical protein
VIVQEHDDAWVRGFRTGRIAQGDDIAYGFLPDNQSLYTAIRPSPAISS